MHEIMKNKPTGQHAAVHTAVSRTRLGLPHAKARSYPSSLTAEPIKLEGGGEGGNATGDLQWQTQQR